MNERDRNSRSSRGGGSKRGGSFRGTGARGGSTRGTIPVVTTNAASTRGANATRPHVSNPRYANTRTRTETSRTRLTPQLPVFHPSRDVPGAVELVCNNDKPNVIVVTREPYTDPSPTVEVFPSITPAIQHSINVARERNLALVVPPTYVSHVDVKNYREQSLGNDDAAPLSGGSGKTNSSSSGLYNYRQSPVNAQSKPLVFVLSEVCQSNIRATYGKAADNDSGKSPEPVSNVTGKSNGSLSHGSRGETTHSDSKVHDPNRVGSADTDVGSSSVTASRIGERSSIPPSLIDSRGKYVSTFVVEQLARKVLCRELDSEQDLPPQTESGTTSPSGIWRRGRVLEIITSSPKTQTQKKSSTVNTGYRHEKRVSELKKLLVRYPSEARSEDDVIIKEDAYQGDFEPTSKQFRDRYKDSRCACATFELQRRPRAASEFRDGMAALKYDILNDLSN